MSSLRFNGVKRRGRIREGEEKTKGGGEEEEDLIGSSKKNKGGGAAMWGGEGKEFRLSMVWVERK